MFLAHLVVSLFICVLLCPSSYSVNRRGEDENVEKLRRHFQQKAEDAKSKHKARTNYPLAPTVPKPEEISTFNVTPPAVGIIVSTVKSPPLPKASHHETILAAPMPGDKGLAVQFYNLSMYLSTKDGTDKHFKTLPKLHLVRVPKASSSSLSAVARRAVGCSPPGPCCRFPGVPAGSCPRREMSQCEIDRKVIGCTDHFPNAHYLAESRVPSISMMRNPFTRSLSGFFYPGIHHNSDCQKDIDICFQEYTSSTKWKNIVVKMLTGLYPYSEAYTCADDTMCAHSAQLAYRNLKLFAFMGVAEMWELSLLVFYRKFPMLEPVLSEFKMATEENSITKGNRVNMKAGYVEFKRTALEKHGTVLHEQNSLDAALYRIVISNLCDDLHALSLWNHTLVSTYWANNSPYKTDRCP